MTEFIVNSEYLAASAEAQHDLVFLHGWGSSADIWRSVLPSLRPWANVTLIDLSSCLEEQSAAKPTLQALLSAIMTRTPHCASYVGWSFGGAIASALAAAYPARVCSLLTVCSNPKFIAEANWPGMLPGTFSAFTDSVGADPDKALRRFDTLQSQGAVKQRSLQRELAAVRRNTTWNASNLLAQLHMLGDLDQRSLLLKLTQPQLHVFAEADELVPVAVCEQLDVLLRNVSNARCCSMGNVSHVVPLQAPQALAEQITAFVARQGVPEVAAVLATLPSKREIGRSFSSAAQRYDSVAGLQRDVGDSLIEGICFDGKLPSTVLDLGCGTGHFYSRLMALAPDIEYLGLDLAQGMVEFARDRFPGDARWLVGDAEHLPLAANSVDLVFSSLAIQWCSSPQRVFAEVARVLKPGGQCVFTSLGPATLRELRASWASVDDYQHVNSFVPATILKQAAADVPGIVMTLREEAFSVQYDRVGELLRELKVLGAHNMNQGRAEGLTTAGALSKMYEAYEQWRSQGKLPATYDVQFGLVEKLG